MSQLEHIEAIEKRLWSAADNLRANSNFASNQYFLPVMGLVFLRHAYSRYLAVKDKIEPNLPRRGGKPRALSKEDFSQQSAIFLRPEAQFDYLVALPESADRIRAVIAAMESIEADYENLRGTLPKSEYQELDNQVLGQLLRTLNPEELKKVSGDVFGRIYEYFLTQFANQGAHDGGEFFTPVSLVSLIAHVLDPACGSGGMFEQSARIVEEHGQRPTERLTFRGLEKNATTIRLAKMNLAVHGLEGDIQKAITYYEDPHELVGKADYVMANPPFNVDEIDADKVKRDPRLPFGLPGVNKKEKVSNGNYVWISYFYSYLNDKGRAGFVMSSQASSAGGGEAKVRQKLVETGDVDAMIAIRSNFFYTRTVPCELWFFDKAKRATPSPLAGEGGGEGAKARGRNTVLMIDARNVYRKVTRKIYDFSPEQQQNLQAIVWLYRGESERYLQLVSQYLGKVASEAQACFELKDETSRTAQPLPDYAEALKALRKTLTPSLSTLPSATPHAGPEERVAEVLKELEKETELFDQDIAQFRKNAKQNVGWVSPKGVTQQADKKNTSTSAAAKAMKDAVDSLEPMAEASRDLIKQTDLIYKLATRLIEALESSPRPLAGEGLGERVTNRDIARARKTADEARHLAVEQLKQVRYFWKQAHWLTERFPDAQLRDVAGLVKLVDLKEIEANDWSLTPGRYVGVAPEEVDENFDFEETLREIHVELEDLNAEAVTLAATIKRNFEELGI